MLPEETQDIGIVEGKDYCTLVTCTPYAINTHRLLVRGERTEYIPPEELAGCTLHGNFYTAATLTEGLWQVTFPLENTD